MQLKKLFVVALGVSSLMFAGCTQQRDFDAQAQQTPATIETPASTEAPERDPDVPYVPTPNEVVTQMLQLASVKKGDVIYDLGSGDGRIVITAAQKYGTRGVGIDINPERIREANANAQAAKVTDRVQFRQQDLFKTNLSEATVVTLYLLPDINVKLRPQLFKQLKPGTRIVSHDFDMGEWKPERVVQVQGPTRQHTLYYWVVPETVPANLK
jgi:predicted O-methyltransferase YrrM